MMFLKTRHGTDVVHLDIVCQASQTLPPDFCSGYVLTYHIGGSNVHHVQSTADDKSLQTASAKKVQF